MTFSDNYTKYLSNLEQIGDDTGLRERATAAWEIWTNTFHKVSEEEFFAMKFQECERQLSLPEEFQIAVTGEPTWSKPQGIHPTSYYVLVKELNGVQVKADGLIFSIGFRFGRSGGGYNAHFLRLYGRCSLCNAKVQSVPIFGLVGLGAMLAEFQTDEMLHRCPIVEARRRNSDIENLFQRCLHYSLGKCVAE